jgi:hypothetical protein
VHNLSCMFISILHMFQATMCSSSGVITVSVQHLVFVTLCGWPSGMQGGILHTRRSSTQINKFQVLHKYSYFSWWWAHSCLKHVENRNKHTRQIVHQIGFIYKTIAAVAYVFTFYIFYCVLTLRLCFFVLWSPWGWWTLAAICGRAYT